MNDPAANYGPSPTSQCLRCGTCCRKGGPALHHADLPLLRQNILCLEDLATLRVGEPAFDQITGRVILLDAECLKIRPGNRFQKNPAGWNTGCRFYQHASASPEETGLDHQDGRCAIHENKPLECAALKCWDTVELARAAATPRLSRLDILPAHSALAELVRDQESRYPVADLRRHLQTPTRESAERLHHAAAYDAALRNLLQEKTGLAPNQTAFLLGRPLQEVLQGLRRWMGRHADSDRE